MKISGKLTYILLASALVVCVGGMGFLGYSLITSSGTVKMQNFENASKTDVLKWVTKNKLEENIKYEYEYSDTVEEGNVISQSIKENDKVEGNFTVTISKGSVIALDINDYKTKEDFEKFIAKYPNVKVTYEDGDSSSTTSELLKFSKNSIDIKADQLTVFLSIEKDNSKDDNKDDDKNNTGTKATIPNNLLGIEESKFIKTLNDLGFKNLKKSDTKYYSFTSKKDMIYSYDDGKFDTGKTINYALSLGDYPTAFDAKEYNGQTLDAANKIVKKYNDLNAHITLKTTNVQTTDTKLVGKLADCKCAKNATNSNITCNLYASPSTTIAVDNYAGKSESDLLKFLNDKGIKYNKQSAKYSTYAKDTIAYNDTGNKTKNDVINYYLSLGTYEYYSGDYIDQSLNNANSKVSYYNSLGANISFVSNFQEIYDEPNKNNIVSSCTPAYYNGNKVTLTCTVLKYVQTYSIMSVGFYTQTKSGNSYEETVNNMKDALSDFTNVTYNPVSSEDRGPGQILDITVNGAAIDASKKYKSNDHIIVTIVQTQTN